MKKFLLFLQTVLITTASYAAESGQQQVDLLTKIADNTSSEGVAQKVQDISDRQEAEARTAEDKAKERAPSTETAKRNLLELQIAQNNMSLLLTKLLQSGSQKTFLLERAGESTINSDKTTIDNYLTEYCRGGGGSRRDEKLGCSTGLNELGQNELYAMLIPNHLREDTLVEGSKLNATTRYLELISPKLESDIFSKIKNAGDLENVKNREKLVARMRRVARANIANSVYNKSLSERYSSTDSEGNITPSVRETLNKERQSRMDANWVEKISNASTEALLREQLLMMRLNTEINARNLEYNEAIAHLLATMLVAQIEINQQMADTIQNAQ